MRKGKDGLEVEDRIDRFGEGGMVGKGSGCQRGCCAVELSVKLSGCHFAGIFEFLFDVLHDAGDFV